MNALVIKFFQEMLIFRTGIVKDWDRINSNMIYGNMTLAGQPPLSPRPCWYYQQIAKQRKLQKKVISGHGENWLAQGGGGHSSPP